MPNGYYILIGAIIGAVFSVLTTFLNSLISKNKSRNEFKRDHSYSQLKNLYLSLYGIVAQSEFLRYRYKFSEQFSLIDIPFLEVHNTITKTIFNLKEGVSTSISTQETDITKLNKKALVELILQKQEYASQKLLKLAVAYRYSHNFYLMEGLSDDQKDEHQIYELLLIYELVITIIKETNEKLEDCNMDYSINEHEYGIMDYNIFITTDEYHSLVNK
jgi:hypothetical protein